MRDQHGVGRDPFPISIRPVGPHWLGRDSYRPLPVDARQVDTRRFENWIRAVVSAAG